MHTKILTERINILNLTGCTTEVKITFLHNKMNTSKPVYQSISLTEL